LQNTGKQRQNILAIDYFTGQLNTAAALCRERRVLPRAVKDFSDFCLRM